MNNNNIKGIDYTIVKKRQNSCLLFILVSISTLFTITFIITDIKRNKIIIILSFVFT